MVLTTHRVVSFDITNVPTSINRINWGVYMSRVGTILENSMSYVRTIRIPWPSVTFTPLERQSYVRTIRTPWPSITFTPLERQSYVRTIRTPWPSITFTPLERQSYVRTIRTPWPSITFTPLERQSYVRTIRTPWPSITFTPLERQSYVRTIRTPWPSITFTPLERQSYVRTIRILWPSITFTPLERQSCNTTQARLLQSESHNTMIDDMNAIFTDRIRILRESLLSSRAMIPSLGNVDRHPTKQRKRRDASKSLGSDFCKTMDNSASDSSIHGTLGKVTNALMGAPSTACVTTVDGRRHHRRRQTSSRVQNTYAKWTR